MWKAAFSGRSETGGSVSGSRPSSGRKKSSGSVVSSTSRDDRKKSSGGRSSRGSTYDDYDDDTRSAYGPAPSSRSNNAGGEPRGLTESAVQALGRDDDLEWEDEDARDARSVKSGRSRARSERHEKSGRRKGERSRSKEREKEKGRKEEKRKSGSGSGSGRRESERKSQSREDGYVREGAREREREGERAMPDMGSFEQFPGQYSGGMMGQAGQADHMMSGGASGMPSAPDQQFGPTREDSYGAASGYYLDQGESVLHQPGVRTNSPNMLVNPDHHLHAASLEAQPAEDTGQGAAAEFFSGDLVMTEEPQPINKPGKKPSKSSSSSSSKPSKPGRTSSLGTAAAATAALGMAGVAAAGRPSPQHSNSMPGGFPGAEYGSGGVPNKPGRYPSEPATSSVSGAPPYATGQGTPSKQSANGAYYGGMNGTSNQGTPNKQSTNGAYYSSPSAQSTGKVAGKQGANGGYYSASSAQSNQGTPARPGNEGSYYASPSGRQSEGKTGKYPSQHSDNAGMYAAGAAAAGLAGYAAYESNRSHQQKYSQSQSQSQYGGTQYSRPPPGYAQSAAYTSGSYADMQQQRGYHEHRGPMTKLKDGFLNLLSTEEDVVKMEAYTEAIGVCKHCFDPRSSPWDAPRRHHYHSHSPRRDSFEDLRRRRSLDKMRKHGSRENLGGRVDKDSRYYASESKRKSGSKADLAAAGLAGVGLAAGANALFNSGKDFEDTYSVKSGHRASSAARRRSRSSSRERRRKTTHGIVGRDSRDEYAFVRTKDGRAEKRKVQRSRSRSNDRKSGILGAAAGAALGTSAFAASRRRRSSSRSSRSSGRGSPGLAGILGFGDNKSKRGRHSPRNSYYGGSQRPGREEQQSSGILGGFFTSSPPKRRTSQREHRKKKAGFFNFGNGSSSSSDGEMAFGEGFSSKTNLPLRRKSSTKNVKRKNSDQRLAATITGIGATAAALAAAQKGHRVSKRTSRPELGAKRRQVQQQDSSEEEWEDELPSDASSGSSLAFGDFDNRLSRRQSKESINSTGSGAGGLGAWGWRWGGKKDKKKRRVPSPPPAYPPRPDASFVAPAAAAGVAAVAARDAFKPSSSYDSRGSSMSGVSPGPLQYIDPRPVSEEPLDSNRVNMPGAFDFDEPPVIRPGPGPIQQPKPIAPIQPAFTDKADPDMFNDRPKPRRTQSSPVQSSFGMKDAAMIGAAALGTASIIASQSGRRSKEPNNVRFGLTEEQQAKEEREKRREREKVERNERARADRERALKQEAERFTREQDVLRRREEENRAAAEAMVERERREAEAQREMERQEALRREEARKAEEIRRQDEARRRREAEIDAELEAKRRELEEDQRRSQRRRDSQSDTKKAELEEQRRSQRRRDSQSDRKSERSGSIPWGAVAAGTAAAATAGAVYAERSKDKNDRDSASSTSRNTRDRSDSYKAREITPAQQSPELDSEFFKRSRRSPNRSPSGDRQIEEIARRAYEKIREDEERGEGGEQTYDRMIQEREEYYHEPQPSQAEIFAPEEILDRKAGYKERAAGDGVREKGKDGFVFDDELYGPQSFERSRHAPFGVPRMGLIAPTPPPDPKELEKKKRREKSPLSLAKSDLANEYSNERPSPSSRSEVGVGKTQRDFDDDARDTRSEPGVGGRQRSRSITWGEPQTHVYEVRTPESYRENAEGYMDAKDVGVGAAAATAAAAVAGGAAIYAASGKDEEEGRRPASREQGDKDIPIGSSSGLGGDYRQPFFESVSDLGISVDSPGTEGAPPVQGFVEGEVAETPRAREEKERKPHIPGGWDDEVKDEREGYFDAPPSAPAPMEEDVPYEMLSKKEKKKRDKEKAAMALEEEFSAPTTTPPVAPEPPMAVEDEVPYEMLSKKDKKKRDKERSAKAFEEEFSAPTTTPPAAPEPPIAEQVEEEIPYEMLSKKDKKKRDKERAAKALEEEFAAPSTPSAETMQTREVESFAAAPPVEEEIPYEMLSKKEKKKRDKERAAKAMEEEFAAPPIIAEPEPSREFQEPEQAVEDEIPYEMLSKKDKKKRDKERAAKALEEEFSAPPVVPEPEPVQAGPADEEEIPYEMLSKKDKKKRDKLKRGMSEDFTSSPPPEPETSYIDAPVATEPEPEWEAPLSKKEQKKREKEAKKSGGFADVAMAAMTTAGIAAVAGAAATGAASTGEDDSADAWDSAPTKKGKKGKKTKPVERDIRDIEPMADSMPGGWEAEKDADTPPEAVDPFQLQVRDSSSSPPASAGVKEVDPLDEFAEGGSSKKKSKKKAKRDSLRFDSEPQVGSPLRSEVPFDDYLAGGAEQQATLGVERAPTNGYADETKAVDGERTSGGSKYEVDLPTEDRTSRGSKYEVDSRRLTESPRRISPDDSRSVASEPTGARERRRRSRVGEYYEGEEETDPYDDVRSVAASEPADIYERRRSKRRSRTEGEEEATDPYDDVRSVAASEPADSYERKKSKRRSRTEEDDTASVMSSSRSRRSRTADDDDTASVVSTRSRRDKDDDGKKEKKGFFGGLFGKKSSPPPSSSRSDAGGGASLSRMSTRDSRDEDGERRHRRRKSEHGDDDDTRSVTSERHHRRRRTDEEFPDREGSERHHHRRRTNDDYEASAKDNDRDQSFLGMRVEGMPPLPASGPATPLSRSSALAEEDQGFGTPGSAGREAEDGGETDFQGPGETVQAVGNVGEEGEREKGREEALRSLGGGEREVAVDELPALPASPPGSPTEVMSAQTPHRPPPLGRPTSTTAVPLRFPFGQSPSTPGHGRMERAVSFGGYLPSSPSTPGAHKTRQGRPTSTEMMPLYLVERTRKPVEVDQEGDLPSLPSSKPSSRASSVVGSEEWADANEEFGSPGAERSWERSARGLEDEGANEGEDLLGSGQTTPRAVERPGDPFAAAGKAGKQQPEYWTWKDFEAERAGEPSAPREKAQPQFYTWEDYERDEAWHREQKQGQPEEVPALPASREASRAREPVEEKEKEGGKLAKGVAAGLLGGGAAALVGYDALKSRDEDKAETAPEPELSSSKKGKKKGKKGKKAQQQEPAVFEDAAPEPELPTLETQPAVDAEKTREVDASSVPAQIEPLSSPTDAEFFEAEQRFADEAVAPGTQDESADVHPAERAVEGPLTNLQEPETSSAAPDAQFDKPAEQHDLPPASEHRSIASPTTSTELPHLPHLEKQHEPGHEQDMVAVVAPVEASTSVDTEAKPEEGEFAPMVGRKQSKKDKKAGKKGKGSAEKALDAVLGAENAGAAADAAVAKDLPEETGVLGTEQNYEGVASTSAAEPTTERAMVEPAPETSATEPAPEEEWEARPSVSRKQSKKDKKKKNKQQPLDVFGEETPTSTEEAPQEEAVVESEKAVLAESVPLPTSEESDLRELETASEKGKVLGAGETPDSVPLPDVDDSELRDLAWAESVPLPGVEATEPRQLEPAESAPLPGVEERAEQATPQDAPAEPTDIPRDVLETSADPQSATDVASSVQAPEAEPIDEFAWSTGSKKKGKKGEKGKKAFSRDEEAPVTQTAPATETASALDAAGPATEPLQSVQQTRDISTEEAPIQPEALDGAREAQPVEELKQTADIPLPATESADHVMQDSTETPVVADDGVPALEEATPVEQPVDADEFWAPTSKKKKGKKGKKSALTFAEDEPIIEPAATSKDESADAALTETPLPVAEQEADPSRDIDAAEATPTVDAEPEGFWAMTSSKKKKGKKGKKVASFADEDQVTEALAVKTQDNAEAASAEPQTLEAEQPAELARDVDLTGSTEAVSEPDDFWGATSSKKKKGKKGKKAAAFAEDDQVVELSENFADTDFTTEAQPEAEQSADLARDVGTTAPEEAVAEPEDFWSATPSKKKGKKGKKGAKSADEPPVMEDQSTSAQPETANAGAEDTFADASEQPAEAPTGELVDQTPAEDFWTPLVKKKKGKKGQKAAFDAPETAEESASNTPLETPGDYFDVPSEQPVEVSRDVAEAAVDAPTPVVEDADGSWAPTTSKKEKKGKKAQQTTFDNLDAAEEPAADPRADNIETGGALVDASAEQPDETARDVGEAAPETSTSSVPEADDFWAPTTSKKKKKGKKAQQAAFDGPDAAEGLASELKGEDAQEPETPGAFVDATAEQPVETPADAAEITPDTAPEAQDADDFWQPKTSKKSKKGKKGQKAAFDVPQVSEESVSKSVSEDPIDKPTEEPVEASREDAETQPQPAQEADDFWTPQPSKKKKGKKGQKAVFDMPEPSVEADAKDASEAPIDEPAAEPFEASRDLGEAAPEPTQDDFRTALPSKKKKGKKGKKPEAEASVQEEEPSIAAPAEGTPELEQTAATTDLPTDGEALATPQEVSAPITEAPRDVQEPETAGAFDDHTTEAAGDDVPLQRPADAAPSVPLPGGNENLATTAESLGAPPKDSEQASVLPSTSEEVSAAAAIPVPEDTGELATPMEPSNSLPADPEPPSSAPNVSEVDPNAAAVPIPEDDKDFATPLDSSEPMQMDEKPDRSMPEPSGAAREVSLPEGDQDLATPLEPTGPLATENEAILSFEPDSAAPPPATPVEEDEWALPAKKKKGKKSKTIETPLLEEEEITAPEEPATVADEKAAEEPVALPEESTDLLQSAPAAEEGDMWALPSKKKTKGKKSKAIEADPLPEAVPEDVPLDDTAVAVGDVPVETPAAEIGENAETQQSVPAASEEEDMWALPSKKKKSKKDKTREPAPAAENTSLDQATTTEETPIGDSPAVPEEIFETPQATPAVEEEDLWALPSKKKKGKKGKTTEPVISEEPSMTEEQPVAESTALPEEIFETPQATPAAEEEEMWAIPSKKKKGKKAKQSQFEPESEAVSSREPPMEDSIGTEVEQAPQPSTETALMDSQPVVEASDDFWAVPTKKQKGKKGKKSGTQTPVTPAESVFAAPAEEVNELDATSNIPVDSAETIETHEMPQVPTETAPDNIQPTIEAEDDFWAAPTKKNQGKKGKKSGAQTPVTFEDVEDVPPVEPQENVRAASGMDLQSADPAAVQDDASSQPLPDNELSHGVDLEPTSTSNAPVADEGTEPQAESVSLLNNGEGQQTLTDETQLHSSEKDIEQTTADTQDMPSSIELPEATSAEEQALEPSREDHASTELTADYNAPAETSQDPAVSRSLNNEPEQPTEDADAYWAAPSKKKKKGKKGRLSAIEPQDVPDQDLGTEVLTTASKESGPMDVDAPAKGSAEGVSTPDVGPEAAVDNDSFWAAPTTSKKGKKGKKGKRATLDFADTADADRRTTEQTEVQTADPEAAQQKDSAEPTDLHSSNILPDDAKDTEIGSRNIDENADASSVALATADTLTGEGDSHRGTGADPAQQEDSKGDQSSETLHQDTAMRDASLAGEETKNFDAPQEIGEEESATPGPIEDTSFDFTSKKSKKDKKKTKKEKSQSTDPSTEAPREAEATSTSESTGVLAAAGAMGAGALAAVGIADSTPDTAAVDEDAGKGDEEWPTFSTKKSKKDKRKAKRGYSSATPAAEAEPNETIPEPMDFDAPQADTPAGAIASATADSMAEPTDATVDTTSLRHDENLERDMRGNGQPEHVTEDESKPAEEEGQRDIDFAATVAAGLQDSGFNPDMVVNDPVFHRRATPPGESGEADPEEVFESFSKKKKKGKKGKQGAPTDDEQSRNVSGVQTPQGAGNDFDAVLAQSLEGTGIDPSALEQTAPRDDGQAPDDLTGDSADFSFSTTRRKKGKKKAQPIEDESPAVGAAGNDATEDVTLPGGSPKDEAPVEDSPGAPMVQAQESLSPSVERPGLSRQLTVDTNATETTSTLTSTPGTPLPDPAADLVHAGDRDMDVDDMDKAYRAYKRNKRKQKKEKWAALQASEPTGEAPAANDFAAEDSRTTHQTPEETSNESGNSLSGAVAAGLGGDNSPSWSFDNVQEGSESQARSAPSNKDHEVIRDSGYQETSSPRLSRESDAGSSRALPKIRSTNSKESLHSRRSNEALYISTDTGPEWDLKAPKQRGGHSASREDSNTLHARTPSQTTQDTPLESTSRNRASYLFQTTPENLRSASLEADKTPTQDGSLDAGGYFAEERGSVTGHPRSVSNPDRAAFSPPPEGITSPRIPLDTIPEERLAHKRSIGNNRNGTGPDHKSIRRTETPQSIRARERVFSPTGFAPTRSVSNPSVDEHGRPVDARSPSVVSNRSTFSAHQWKSPDEARSYSRTSNRSNTPSLRRISLSGDLRAASQASRRGGGESASAVGSRSSPKTIPFEAPPTPPSNDDEVMNTGASRSAVMSDVYQGLGDAQGSQVSPTRPPSMRKRQSMHIIDLESKLEQLAAENQALQHAKQDNGASRGLDDGPSIEQALRSRDLEVQQKDNEINQIRAMLQPMQDEIARLTEMNNGLTEANRNLVDDSNGRYATLQQEHADAHEQWQSTSRELVSLRQEHGQLTSGLRSAVEAELASALASKNTEIRELREELDMATEKIRALQTQIQSTKGRDFLTVRDEDYFDGACQKLCQHVQQWVLRFSKVSDKHICRLSTDLKDDKVEARLDNAVLDGSDVDKLLGDRVRRRDVFMSVVMTMVWEYVFTRYLFGMDREQRQKLKGLEKLLSEVGPPRAVAQWRATTLTLLAKRPVFSEQRDRDEQAVAQEIFDLLCALLPPPSSSKEQLLSSLLRVVHIAVDLSIEMRTQRSEYIMLPPLLPEYDTNGDLMHKVHFNASLMNERSGMFSSNEELEQGRAVVKIVLFPLVVKKGDEVGEGEEEIVVCPAQVLVHNDNNRGKKVVRVESGHMTIDDPRRSRQSLMSRADSEAF